MQVKPKETFIQSFGGLNFIHNYLKENNFSDLALKDLGNRNVTAQYSYGDLLSQLFFLATIGGGTLDESNYLKYQLQDHPDLKIGKAVNLNKKIIIKPILIETRQLFQTKLVKYER